MSFKTRATHDGEFFEVEITSDGELSLPGYDQEQLEYEIAFAAMGGDKSPVLILLDYWLDNPVETICYNFGLDRNARALLAADWAEHVLPIFEKDFPKDKRPREAIEAARDFVAGKIMVGQLAEAGKAAWAASTGASEREEWAAESAAWAADAGVRMAPAGAAARDAAPDSALEQAWQVRHFVHVMECLRAGKKWPKVKETP